MNRDPNLPLTETTYYVLLSLFEPAHGYAILQKVEELSDGQVRLAAGTLYGALENLEKQKMICQIPGDDPRRKIYGITAKGRSILTLDYERMRALIITTDRFITEAKQQYEKN
jgi:DNA-binding PadR family transcriptional regulator